MSIVNGTHKFNRTFSYSGRALRGNLHGHTTRSDGRLSGEEVVSLYRQLRYDFTAITDHDHWEDWGSLSTTDFLVINGVEISPKSNRRHHVLGIGTDYDPCPADDVPDAIKKITDANGIPIVCHPMWSGVHTQMLVDLPHFPILEVMNHGLWGGLGQDESGIWDELLIRDRLVWGIASDDSHVLGQFGNGWIDVWANGLDLGAIKASLLSGAFYASTGPLITEIRVTDREYTIVSPNAQVLVFLSDRGLVKKTFGSFRDRVDRVTYTLPEENPPKFVRALLRDTNGKQALTPPVFIEA